MAYVREKTVRNKKTGKTYTYNQLVEGVWVGGGVRQKVLAHLGEHATLEEAAEATASFFRRAVRESYEQADKASRLEKAIRERWGEPLREYGYSINQLLPEPEAVLRKAYPSGFPEHPRRGEKFRRAFGISDTPGESIKSVGEFVVLLRRYSKAREEYKKQSRAYEHLAYLNNVKEYLNLKQEGGAKSFEQFRREQQEREKSNRPALPVEEDYENI